MLQAGIQSFHGIRRLSHVGVSSLTENSPPDAATEATEIEVSTVLVFSKMADDVTSFSTYHRRFFFAAAKKSVVAALVL